MQPFLGMLFAVPLLGERLDAVTLGFAAAVIATVFSVPVIVAVPVPVAVSVAVYVPLLLSVTAVSVPSVVASATVPPEVVRLFDAASRSCTVIVADPSVVMLVGAAVIIALAVIFVLLYVTFSDVTRAVLIMATLPFALVGGIWLIFVLGHHVSVATAVGFIALAGVA